MAGDSFYGDYDDGYDGNDGYGSAPVSTSESRRLGMDGWSDGGGGEQKLLAGFQERSAEGVDASGDVETDSCGEGGKRGDQAARPPEMDLGGEGNGVTEEHEPSH